MCLVVYIACSKPLETSVWEVGRGVTITELPPENSDVRKQFTNPCVYYVASSQGCGCGFLARYGTGEDLQNALNERRELSKIIQQAGTSGESFQLLIAYSGYETNEIDMRWKLKIGDLVNCDFDEGWDYHVILVDLIE
jgi:hypothetical protein